MRGAAITWLPSVAYGRRDSGVSRGRRRRLGSLRSLSRLRGADRLGRAFLVDVRCTQVARRRRLLGRRSCRTSRVVRPGNPMSGSHRGAHSQSNRESSDATDIRRCAHHSPNSPVPRREPNSRLDNAPARECRDHSPIFASVSYAFRGRKFVSCRPDLANTMIELIDAAIAPARHGRTVMDHGDGMIMKLSPPTATAA